MSERVIQIRNLDKSYKLYGRQREQVLENINIDLTEGLNVIIGDSGSGKSTLLNLISGLDSDYEGEIYFGDKEIKDIKLDIFRKKNIGFIFQNFNLIEKQSVLENVVSALYLNRNFTDEQRKQRALECLAEVGMEEHAKKPVYQLSGGQKQRVSIARALSNSPEIIVADEPTGALDEENSQQVVDILRGLSRRKRIVILVTHNLEHTKYADNVFRIKNGTIALAEYNQFMRVTEDIEKVIASSSSEEVERLISNLVRARSEEENERYIRITDRRRGISFRSTVKFALDSYRVRFLRNLLISIATSFGIIGVIVSLGLSNGLDTAIDKMYNGILSPNQVLVSSRDQKALTDDEFSEIEEMFKKSDIDEYYGQERSGIVFGEFDGEQIQQEDKNSNEDVPFSYMLQKFIYEGDKRETFTVDSEVLEAGKAVDDNKDEIVISTQMAANILDKDILEIEKEDLEPLVDKEMTIQATDEKGKKIEKTAIISGVLDRNNYYDLTYVSSSLFDALADEGMNSTTSQVEGYAPTPQKAIEFEENEAGNESYKVVTLGSSIKQINQLISVVNYTVSFFSITAMIVAIMLIVIVLYIDVINRRKEIGILRALGYSKGNVKNIFLLEAGLIGVVSIIIALAGALAIEKFGNPYFTEYTEIKNTIDIAFKMTAAAILIVLGSIILASLYPAIKAARLDPIQAIRKD